MFHGSRLDKRPCPLFSSRDGEKDSKVSMQWVTATVTLDDWLMTCMRSYVSNRKGEVSTQLTHDNDSFVHLFPESRTMREVCICMGILLLCSDETVHHFLWSDKKNIYVSEQCQILQFFLCSCNLRFLKICRNLTSWRFCFHHPGFRFCDDPWAEFSKRRRFCGEAGVIRRAKCVRGCSGLRAVAALFLLFFLFL